MHTIPEPIPLHRAARLLADRGISVTEHPGRAWFQPSADPDRFAAKIGQVQIDVETERTTVIVAAGISDRDREALLGYAVAADRDPDLVLEAAASVRVRRHVAVLDYCTTWTRRQLADYLVADLLGADQEGGPCEQCQHSVTPGHYCPACGLISHDREEIQ